MRIIKETGSRVVVTGTFTNALTGDFADPTNLEFRVRHPDGTTDAFVYGTDTEVIRTDVGKYRYLLQLADDGTYHWKWIASAVDSSLVLVGEVDAISTSSGPYF